MVSSLPFRSKTAPAVTETPAASASRSSPERRTVPASICKDELYVLPPSDSTISPAPIFLKTALAPPPPMAPSIFRVLPEDTSNIVVAFSILTAELMVRSWVAPDMSMAVPVDKSKVPPVIDTGPVGSVTRMALSVVPPQPPVTDRLAVLPASKRAVSEFPGDPPVQLPSAPQSLLVPPVQLLSTAWAGPKAINTQTITFRTVERKYTKRRLFISITPI